ncbi:MAG: methyltransferase [Treponema sp.]|jgi:[methyl-Co(III) methanol-specific corrinoid protein]:coenzyme M methyltransferase|nr:methyltransferase [Treponema sp.]
MTRLKMSPAERVKAVLENRDFDVYPAINPTSVVTAGAMEIARSFFPSAHTNAMEMAALAAVGHDVFGFDSVAPYFSVHLEAAALGAEVDWNDAVNTPVIVKKPVKRIDDFNIPPSFLRRTEFQRLIKACEILKKKYSGRVPVIGKVVGPWTLAYNLYGVENLVLDTILEPEKTKDLIGELAVIPVEFAKAQFDAGADMITWADHATSDLVSAKIYEEFLLPVHKKAAKALRRGGPVILHTCGNVMDRLDCIARTGFTLFHMDSRNDIAAAVRQAASSIIITGCINNPVTLGQGTPAMV